LTAFGAHSNLRAADAESPPFADAMARHLKVIFEKHPDGYVAYPLGLKGVVVGEGDTYDAALSNVRSAIKFHIESFGPQVIESHAL
jgi:predicted RNase H-like HicB family nuclease